MNEEGHGTECGRGTKSKAGEPRAMCFGQDNNTLPRRRFVLESHVLPSGHTAKTNKETNPRYTSRDGRTESKREITAALSVSSLDSHFTRKGRRNANLKEYNLSTYKRVKQNM